MMTEGQFPKHGIFDVSPNGGMKMVGEKDGKASDDALAFSALLGSVQEGAISEVQSGDLSGAPKYPAIGSQDWTQVSVHFQSDFEDTSVELEIASIDHADTSAIELSSSSALFPEYQPVETPASTGVTNSELVREDGFVVDEAAIVSHVTSPDSKVGIESVDVDPTIGIVSQEFVPQSFGRASHSDAEQTVGQPRSAEIAIPLRQSAPQNEEVTATELTGKQSTPIAVSKHDMPSSKTAIDANLATSKNSDTAMVPLRETNQTLSGNSTPETTQVEQSRKSDIVSTTTVERPDRAVIDAPNPREGAAIRPSREDGPRAVGQSRIQSTLVRHAEPNQPQNTPKQSAIGGAPRLSSTESDVRLKTPNRHESGTVHTVHHTYFGSRASATNSTQTSSIPAAQTPPTVIVPVVSQDVASIEKTTPKTALTPQFDRSLVEGANRYGLSRGSTPATNVVKTEPVTIKIANAPLDPRVGEGEFAFDEAPEMGVGLSATNAPTAAPRETSAVPMAPTPAGPAAPTVAAQIVQAIASADRPQIEVQLSPEELGSVRIVMAARDSGLHVTIYAERTETLDLLRRDEAGFSADLTSMGFSQGDMTFEQESPTENTLDPDKTSEFDTTGPQPATRSQTMTLGLGSLDLRL